MSHCVHHYARGDSRALRARANTMAAFIYNARRKCVARTLNSSTQTGVEPTGFVRAIDDHLVVWLQHRMHKPLLFDHIRKYSTALSVFAPRHTQKVQLCARARTHTALPQYGIG